MVEANGGCGKCWAAEAVVDSDRKAAARVVVDGGNCTVGEVVVVVVVGGPKYGDEL